MIISRQDLVQVLDRLATEDRLSCVVDGETTKTGTPAPICSKIITNHKQMCAGCAAKQLLYAAGVEDSARHNDPGAA